MLDQRVEFFNTSDFIANDPISVPHRFLKKEDIEIAAFFAATFAWGNRKTIISKSLELMKRMDNAPYDFIRNANARESASLEGFAHRTFQFSDSLHFISALQQIYLDHGGLEDVFTYGYNANQSIKESLIHFRTVFLNYCSQQRTRKHISDPASGSAAKRLNLFLRWMVRSDENGVDFGIWHGISTAHLMCPLDLHSGRVARKLGLLSRRQNDWRAVEELTAALLIFDPIDPVKYDFALFGSGIHETYK